MRCAAGVAVMVVGLLVPGAAAAQDKCFRLANIHGSGESVEGDSGTHVVAVGFGFQKCSVWAGGLTGITGTGSFDGSDVQAVVVNGPGTWDGNPSVTAHMDGSVTIYGDTLVEGRQQVVFTFSAPGARFHGASSVFYFADDDSTDLVGSASEATFIEEGDAQTVTVTVQAEDAQIAGATTVGLTFSGSATEGVDYLVSGELDLIVPARSTAAVSTMLTITPVDDDVEEFTETITVTATPMVHSVHGPDVGAAEVVTWMLTEDDTGSVTLSAAPGELAEADGATGVVITATLSTVRTAETVVTLSLGGSATLGTDFTVQGGVPTITVPAGMTSAIGTLTLVPVQDAVHEPGGEVIEVEGSAAGVVGVTGVTLTLADDDAAPTVTLALVPATVTEGATAMVAVTAELVGSTVEHDLASTWTVGGTATSGSDVNVTLPALTIAAGERRASGVASVEAVEDNEPEGAETVVFTLVLASAGNEVVATTSASVTIEDNDVAPEPPGEPIEDPSAPSIVRVVLGGRCGVYGVGSELDVDVDFDGPVVVGGEPAVIVRVGEEGLLARYGSGSGTARLRFTATITIGAEDAEGVDIEANSVFLNGGEIQDAAGRRAALEHDAVRGCQMVDGIVPTVTAVEITSRPVVGDTYWLDEVLVVTVTWSEPVVVTGRARVAVTMGTGVRQAHLMDGDGGRASVRFEYRIVAGDEDRDGVSIRANRVLLAGGVLEDAAGNAARLGHGALADQAEHRVAAVPAALGERLPNLALLAGGEVASVVLGSAFVGVRLMVSVASSEEDVAAVTASEGTAVVTSGREGTAMVTVTGWNVLGGTRQTFQVVVTTAPAEVQVWTDVLAGVGRTTLTALRQTVEARRRADGALSSRARFSDSGFAMPLEGAGAGREWTLWGRVGTQDFQGNRPAGSYDGTMESGYGGVDVRSGAWLAGVVMSRSASAATYGFRGRVVGDGELTTRFRSVTPYVSWRPRPGTDVWMLAAGGWGTASTVRTHVGGLGATSRLLVGVAMAGVRQVLRPAGGLRLALVADSGRATVRTADGAASLDGLKVGVSESRVGMEASTSMQTGVVAFCPFVEVVGRHDGGDGPTGRGVEIAAGVHVSSGRFGLEVRGYRLAWSGEGYQERGVQLAATVGHRVDGRGLELSVRPQWGRAQSDRVWWEQGLAEHGVAAGGLGERVDGRVGYGVGVRRRTVTPYVEIGAAAGGRRVRVGVRVGDGGVGQWGWVEGGTEWYATATAKVVRIEVLGRVGL